MELPTRKSGQGSLDTHFLIEGILDTHFHLNKSGCPNVPNVLLCASTLRKEALIFRRLLNAGNDNELNRRLY